MKREIIKRNNYTINFIKTNKFKNCQISIYFKRKIEKKEIVANSLLMDCLTYSTNKYPSKILFQRELEYLYDAYISGGVTKNGNVIINSLTATFLNPKYCDDKMDEELVTMLMEVLFNPNIKNDLFDQDAFKVCKKKYVDYLVGSKENSTYVAGIESLKLFAGNTMTGYPGDGLLEDLLEVKNEDVVKAYRDLINNSECIIYIAGNIDKSVVSIIDNYFNNFKGHKFDLDVYVNNEKRDKVLDVSNGGPFKQDTLLVYYNVDLLDKRDRKIVFGIYNNILSTGGLSSKLYKRVREEHSLCYSIYSYYYSLDRYICIYTGINKKDKELCLKLIDECLEEMVQGRFSDKDVEDAIKSQIINAKRLKSTCERIIYNYVMVDLYDGYDVEERIKLYKTVTKEDVMRVAKQLKKNMTYLLVGEDQDEGN